MKIIQFYLLWDGVITIKKFLITLSIILIIVSSIFLYIQLKKQLSANTVMDYLIEEKGYKKSEIITLESKWTFLGIPKYHVEVTFKNEPNIVYLYFANDLRGQFEYYEINGETIPPEDLKKYDPRTNAH
ncbi:DUF3139 domain-containing protein [Lysinibacillus xylanilyticus]|uniref:DUF3139 domain-containing protein n=1 Tax=Lysinibacillus xylanilyticus TaxID=582475 RepID=UPI00381E03EF